MQRRQQSSVFFQCLLCLTYLRYQLALPSVFSLHILLAGQWLGNAVAFLRLMIKLVQFWGNITWYTCVQGSFVIVPFEIDSNILTSIPIHSYIVISYQRSRVDFKLFACSKPLNFTPNSSTTKVNLTGLQTWVHKPGVKLTGWYPHIFKRFCSNSFTILPAWGKPYIPLTILMYTHPSCSNFWGYIFQQSLLELISSASSYTRVYPKVNQDRN